MSKFNYIILFVTLFVFSIILIVTTTCLNQPLIPQPTTVQDIVLYPLEPPVPLPITFYIDSRFSDKQNERIFSAADYWYTATKGKIKFIPICDTDTRVFTENEQYSGRYGMWLVKPDQPGTEYLSIRYTTLADALTLNFSIIIFDDSTIENLDTFEKIVRHEFGHWLHLNHINALYPALMNINGGGGNITKWDLLQLEALYGKF